MMKLKPCPFCGSPSDLLHIGQGTEDRESIPIYIFCDACGAQGPWIYTKSKTALTDLTFVVRETKWNRRPKCK